MAQLLQIILALTLFGILSSLGFVYMNPTMPMTTQVTAQATSGFGILTAGYKTFVVSTGAAPQSLDDIASVLPSSSLPPSVGAATWSLTAGGNICLSGQISKAAWQGLTDAATALPSSYVVGADCAGTVGTPTSWPAFVAASLPAVM